MNTAFASASYDAGQYDGRPSGGAASLDADGKVKKVISTVDRDGEFFQKYFSGNRDSRFKVYTNLAYDRVTGTFHGAVLTAATDKDGNTVLHYSINGQDYEFTATREQLEAFRASTFGGKKHDHERPHRQCGRNDQCAEFCPWWGHFSCECSYKCRYGSRNLGDKTG